MPSLGALTSVSDKNKKTIEKQAAAYAGEFDGVPTMVGDMNLAREVKYRVHIYNVGPFSQIIERPGIRIPIEACPKGQDYIICYSFPDIVQEPVRIPGSNEFRTRGVDAKFIAQDCLNPDDPQGTWKNVRPMLAGNSTNENCNLYHFGIFWSVQNPPEADAIGAARMRLTQYCNDLIQQAHTYHLEGQHKLIQKNHRIAADYFGVQTEWHKTLSPQTDCPGCGKKMLLGSIIHDCGYVRDWEAAIKAGMRTREQFEASKK